MTLDFSVRPSFIGQSNKALKRHVLNFYELSALKNLILFYSCFECALHMLGTGH